MSRRAASLLGSLVVVFSLAWLTAAYADATHSKANGNGQGKGTTGPANGNGNSKGTTGGQGSGSGQGNTGTGQDNGQSGDGSGHSTDVPSAGVSAGVQPTEGKVLMRLPGGKDVQQVDGSQMIPVGAHVDARFGKVTVTTAVGSQGATQTGSFWGGIFKVAQTDSNSRYTDIVLVGRLRGCPSGNRAGTSRRGPTRQLWGQDNHGKYRTHGQNSVATVRGTTWLTVESCRGTLTRVTEGSVSVNDLHAGHTVLVTGGHSYLARAGRTR